MIGILHVSEDSADDLQEWTTRNVNELRGYLEYPECIAVLSVAGADHHSFRIEVLAGTIAGECQISPSIETMMIFRGMPFTDVPLDLIGDDPYTQVIIHTLSEFGFSPDALGDVSVSVRKDLGCLVVIVNDGGAISDTMMACPFITDLPLDVNTVMH